MLVWIKLPKFDITKQKTPHFKRTKTIYKSKKINFMLKVISKGGKKRSFQTAQVVIRENGRSITKHLWLLYNEWVDKNGRKYDLPKSN